MLCRILVRCRALRIFPGKKFSIPGTKNYYPGLGVTPNQRSLAKDHFFSGFCWHPSLIHCCSTPCDQDDKMPSDGRSWMEEGSDSAGICTVGINLIFQSHFHSWTCPWRNPVAWLQTGHAVKCGQWTWRITSSPATTQDSSLMENHCKVQLESFFALCCSGKLKRMGYYCHSPSIG